MIKPIRGRLRPPSGTRTISAPKKKKRGGSRTIILTNRNTFVPIKLLTRPQILPNRLKKKK